MLCGYCMYASPYIKRQALFVINGQSVCEDHVDTATQEFGESLHRLQEELEQG